jgi:hypothetical protein
MQAALRRLAAVVAMAILGVTGLAVAATWSPASVGFVAPASADDDGSEDDGADDDDGSDDGSDDDGGQAPAGGVDTGQGGTANPAQEDDDADDDGADDDDGDDDGGQAPAGGVDTGQGGTADAWTGEPASSDRSGGAADLAGTVAPIAGLGLASLLFGRLVIARLRGSQG